MHPVRLTLIPLLALITPATAAGSEQEVLYRVHREMLPFGVGVPVIEDLTTLSIDERGLLDSDGRALEQNAEVWEDESGLVQSLVAIAVTNQRELSSGELEEAYLAAHPDKVAADLWESRAESVRVLSPMPTHVDGALLTWAASASPTAIVEAVVVMREQPALNLPRVDSAFGIALSDESLPSRRDSAIAERKVLVRALQDPTITLIEQSGGEFVSSGWSVNRFTAWVTAEALNSLATHPDVARVEELGEYSPDGDGEDIRHATQVVQLLNSNYDGGTPSGRNPLYSDLVVAVVDSSIDQDHPSVSYNLGEWRYWNSSLGTFQVAGAGLDSADGFSDHGSGVVTQLLADGTQDGSLSPSDAVDASGMTDESALVFVQHWNLSKTVKASRVDRLDETVDVNADIVNMSASSSATCDVLHSDNYAANLLYLDDTFLVNTPGNPGNSGSACTVESPGTAAGSFTANASDRNAADINAAAITSGSARGGDIHGRAMIDMVATSGRSSATNSVWDDSYATLGIGTSYAAPVIAGGAANVKDMMIETFGSGTANHVGNLFATMLLMGDGQTEAGAKRDVSNPQMDELWGAGRLRLRMWGGDGLDAPHKTGISRTNLSDGSTWTRGVNLSGGSNVALPSSVDTLTAVLWWFEPGIGNTSNVADISFQVCNQSNVCYDSGDTSPGARRVFVPSPGGDTWEIRVTGVNIPASTNPNYLYLQPKRQIHVTYMYEDRLRDDVNGPTCFDEIDMSCTECCSQAGALCVPSDC